MPVTIYKTALGPIEARLDGTGKPLLFIHGGHVDCREKIFQKGLDPSTYHFICPSRPGYGRTPLSDDNATPKGTADLFIALLDTLGVSKVTVIGISAGGLAALEFAANYPERLDNLILMSAITKTWFSKNDKVYKGGKIIFSPAIESMTWILYRLAFRFFDKSMTKMMFKELSSFRPVEFSHDEIDELRQMTMRMRSHKGFSSDLDQTIETSSLSKIECPVLVLHSEYDHSVDITHAQHASQKIRNCTLATFKNRWGHLVWIGRDYDKILIELKAHLIT